MIACSEHSSINSSLSSPVVVLDHTNLHLPRSRSPTVSSANPTPASAILDLTERPQPLRSAYPPDQIQTPLMSEQIQTYKFDVKVLVV